MPNVRTLLNRRKAPIDFLNKELFSLGVMNPRTILRSRRLYKIYSTKRELEIQRLGDNLRGYKLTFLDIGARGGGQNFLAAYYDFFNFYYSEPEEKGLDNLRRMPATSSEKVLSSGFSNKQERKKLYITDHLGCSSTLLPDGPGIKFRSTFTKNPNQFVVNATQDISLIRIDSIFNETNKLDVLKIDVQGTEYEILEGLGSLRPALIQCEISTFVHYKDQKVLLDIMELLDNYGYFPIVLPGLYGHGDAIFVPNFNDKGLKIYSQHRLQYKFILAIYGLQLYGKWSTNYFDQLLNSRVQ